MSDVLLLLCFMSACVRDDDTVYKLCFVKDGETE